MRYFELLVRVRLASLAFAVLVLPAALASRSLSAEESKGISLQEARQVLSDLKDGEVNNDGTQCGITCLYVFLKLNRVDATLARIQELVPIGEHGASLRDLAEASHNLGLRASPVFCSPAELTALRLPAIAHLEAVTEAKPFLHYVLITKVTERGVDLFDPMTNGVRFFNISQLGAVFTGYFLVAAPHPLLRPATLLAAIGLLLTGLATWQIARAWRGARRRGGKDGLAPLGSVCLLVALFCCLPGCGRDGSQLLPENVAQKKVAEDEAAGPIEAPKMDLDLGQLQWNSVARGEFHFRNNSSAPVKLRLGATSCSCLKAELQPKDVLAPGEDGRLIVHLDTMGLESAGKTETCVSLIAGDRNDVLKFCVKGVLDGVVFPQEMYVIRPAQRRSGAVPDLQFAVVTRGLPDFGITKITCASVADFVKMLTKERDRLHTELANPKAPLRAELAKASVSPPVHQASEMNYVRRVSVPMRLEGPPEGYSGRIVVDYTLDGKALQAQTRVLVVGSDDG